MPAGYEDYERVAQVAVDQSAEGASYGWARTEKHSAAFTASIRQRGLFQGSSWYGAYLVMVGKDPSQPLNEAEIQAVIKETVDAIKGAEKNLHPYPAHEVERSRTGRTGLGLL